MKIEMQKTEYPRKAPGFSVWVTDDDGVKLYCAHPQTYECTAKLVAAAFAALLQTPRTDWSLRATSPNVSAVPIPGMFPLQAKSHCCRMPSTTRRRAEHPLPV